VVAVVSEFGRTPRINAAARRDRLSGSRLDKLPGRRQDPRRTGGWLDRTKIGSRPNDSPVEPPQVIASIYQGMGINLDTAMMPGPGDRPVRMVDAEAPIRSMFA